MKKQLHELTLADLIGSRVWRYQSTIGDDDAVVESTELASLTHCSNETFIALTEFTLNDGSVWLGYSSPSDPSGLDYIQPVITTGIEHVRLWQGPSAEEIAAALNRSVAQVFPIAWKARVLVDGDTVKGSVGTSDILTKRP